MVKCVLSTPQRLNSKNNCFHTGFLEHASHLSLVRPTDSHALKLTPSVAVVRWVAMLKQSNVLTAQCDRLQENKPSNILRLFHINIREKYIGRKKR